VAALIAASSLLTCLGNGEQTFVSLLKGIHGASALRHPVPGPVNVRTGYHVSGRDLDGYAADLLTLCATQALAQAGVRPGEARVAALVGTGLRELAAVERFALDGEPLDPQRLAFGPALSEAVPGLTDVVTIANACSAGGHALALAQDMVECGEADAVVVGAADVMTTSMLAMIGRVAEEPTDLVRPFDRDRLGVLLGEGAAAVVVVGEDWPGPRLGRLLATGLSCDAHHETAPDVDGICRAMTDAFARADRRPGEVDLVVAHGTGTALNDPAECTALQRVLHDADPLVTGIKGAVGHLSGAAALANVDVALRCLERGEVPPVVGLRETLPEAGRLRFIKELPISHQPRLIQANAFGFGGVNAVTLLEAA
jgi:3-oxoacyl-[acyl-carrier-protein] synthase II